MHYSPCFAEFDQPNRINTVDTSTEHQFNYALLEEKRKITGERKITNKMIKFAAIALLGLVGLATLSVASPVPQISDTHAILFADLDVNVREIVNIIIDSIFDNPTAQRAFHILIDALDHHH